MANFLGNFESGSDDWLALREGAGVVTGTLVGTVNGLNPWESAFTAWAKATGKISSEITQSLPMRFGQVFEAGIKQVWSEVSGFQVQSDIGTWSHDNYAWARANPDGFWLDGDAKGILEIKTARVPFDEVPPHYRAQVLWYMWVMGMTDQPAKLVALFSGNDLQTFDIYWNQFEFDALFAGVERWREKVLADQKPDWDGSQSTFDTVKKLNTDLVAESEELGQLGVELKLAQIRADEAYTHLMELKSRTLDALQNAKYGYVDDVLVAVRSVNKNGVVSLTVKKDGK